MLYTMWPMALIIFSNVIYNIASKSLPKDCNPFMALIVTYLTASALSLAGFYFFDAGKNFSEALQKVNWAGIGLGVSMVGLEIGFIFLYRVGWKISTASLIAHTLLAVALLLVGIIFYKENLSFRQILGILICLTGVVVLTLDT